MTRLATRFSNPEPVLAAYLCIGDPDLETSLAVARALLDDGVDILELGSPFSDPTADGPVIARASERAIAAGGGLAATLAVARQLRESHPEAPLVLFGYVNPMVVLGERQSVQAAKVAGIDGLLLVDVPFEEGELLRDEAKKQGLDVIPLLTPTSEARASLAREVGSGFLYYVSLTGVTGTGVKGQSHSLELFAEAAERAAHFQQLTGLPTVIGFGIDSAEKARLAISKGARGVVVGSAIVAAIERSASETAGLRSKPEAQAAAVAAARAVVANVRAGMVTNRAG